jgi:hypothetical protein
VRHSPQHRPPLAPPVPPSAAAHPLRHLGHCRADETFVLRSAKGQPASAGSGGAIPGAGAAVPVCAAGAMSTCASSWAEIAVDPRSSGSTPLRCPTRPPTGGVARTRCDPLHRRAQDLPHRRQGSRRATRAAEPCPRGTGAGRLSHPEREQLPQPLEGLDATIPRRLDPLPQELPGLVPHPRHQANTGTAQLHAPSGDAGMTNNEW